jgi:hypothetical protein
MSQPESIKSSGWMFIAGAFAFITILSNSDPLAIPGSFISALLLAAGLLNLRAGYGENVSRFGRNILLTGVIGMVLWYVALASLIIMYYSGIWHATQADGERYWVVLFGGPAVGLLALTLFGLTALLTKPMLRRNWLPFLTGIWYPVIYSIFSAYVILHYGEFPDQYLPASMLMVAIQFLTLCILGFVLIDDSSKDLARA